MEQNYNYSNMNENQINQIVRCIIQSFLNIKELNDTLSNLNNNEIKNLSPIQNLYNSLLKDKDKNILEFENELKKEMVKNNINNIFEKIIETFISSIKCKNLFKIIKLLEEKCQNCQFKTPRKEMAFNYFSFDLSKRFIN